MVDKVKEKKCGCVTYEGQIIKCEKHREKEKVSEERTVRKLAQETAAELGHDLTEFREYQSRTGKWTAYCRRCGSIVIVYDAVPERGDQLAGRALGERCSGGSDTFTALRDAERSADAND